MRKASSMNDLHGISPGRTAACLILVELAEAPDRELQTLVDHHATRLGLDERDRRLAAALALAVLRHASYLDLQYRPFLRIAPTQLKPPVRVLLRLAAAQRFLFERIPPHAIVHETVELGRQVFRLREGELRFLNAVARKIVSQEQPREPEARDPVRYLSARWSVPEFLVRLFLRKYDEPATRRLLAALGEEPATALRVNILKCSAHELVERLQRHEIQASSCPELPSAVVLADPSLISRAVTTPEFRDGFFYVQDCASQFVAHVVRPQAGERILDLCAAPGGKTTHLAELAWGQAQIVATDQDAKRLELVRENVARLGSPKVEIWEYGQVRALAEQQAEAFDAVLVDAPCSALGTIRRHPEIRWRVTPAHLAWFARVQEEVLELAARLVRVGGRIVYATCSPTDAENAEVVRRFLERHPEFAVAPPSAERAQESVGIRSVATEAAARGEPDAPIAQLLQRLTSPDGFVRTWPHFPQWDGFEMVVLRRKE